MSKSGQITSIISFCTHSFRYLAKCIESLRPISKEIIVPICDHFYSGEPENRALLEFIYQSFPHVRFIEFSYSETELYGTEARLDPRGRDWAFHWHATSRLIGALEASTSHLLFCDVDEIADTDLLNNWLSSSDWETYGAVSFSGHFYFLRPDFRSKQTPDCALLIQKKECQPERLVHPDERYALFQMASGPKKAGVGPFFHHYSWVGTKSELIQKARRWGHRLERDWEKLIEQAFEENPSVDFARGYTYEKAPIFFDPLKEPKKVGPKQINQQILLELAGRPTEP